jgi:hypothetical protein
VKKLPAFAFPKPLFGKDPLRDDLRKWLLDWLEQHNDPDPGVTWKRRQDRNVSLCDITLTALAPLMIELLAPRAGGAKAAEKVLAERFMMGFSYGDWINGYDVNEYETIDGVATVVGSIPWSREAWEQSLAQLLCRVIAIRNMNA